MSALPPKADIGTQPRNVRFVPKADICSAANRSLIQIASSPMGQERRFERKRVSWHARVRAMSVDLQMNQYSSRLLGGAALGPKLPTSNIRSLTHRFKLFPNDGRMHLGRVHRLRREAAISAGDDVLASD